MEAFEKLKVWKRSARLSVEIFKSLQECKDFGFKDQLSRASLSVPSNIAEGYERGSRREYVRFLKIAKGSCAELRTQLYIGIEAGLLDKRVAAGQVQEAGEISRMLQGLISKLQAD